jgi:hypothetical protein
LALEIWILRIVEREGATKGREQRRRQGNGSQASVKHGRPPAGGFALAL